VDNTFVPSIGQQSKQIAARRLNELSGVYYDEHDGTLSEVNRSHSHRLELSEADEAALRMNSGDIGARLQIEGKLINKHKMQLAQEQELVMAATMGQAKVSKGTAAIAKTSSVVGASFDERNQLLQQQSKKKAFQLKRNMENESERWFKPEISAKAKKEFGEDSVNESVEERARRMSTVAAQEREQALNQKKEEIYSSFTFHPKIDPISKELGRSPDIKELVENTRGM
jgi:hypothetical protein